MRKLFTKLILLLIFTTSAFSQVDRKEVGNLVIENVPEIPQTLKNRLMQYQNTRSAGFAGWDARGEGLFITTRFGETSQVHYIEKAGGARKQLTFFDEPIAGISVRPESEEQGFLFSKDIGGNELYQIYYFDMRDGSYKMLTDGNSRNMSYLWSRDGDRFAYVSTKRTGQHYDIYLADMEDPEDAEMIFEASGFWGPVSFSPEADKLLIYNYISINESSLSILDIESGELTPLLDVEADERIAMGSGIWAADGSGIYFTSDIEGEFKKLYFHDLASGENTLITDDIDWDISSIIQSEDGDKIAFFVNEGGNSTIYTLDPENNQYSKLQGIPPGLISGAEFNPGRDQLAYGLNSSKTPGDVFVYNLKNNNITQWTFSEVGGLDTEKFIEPEIIHYPTFDEVDGKKRMIPAFYYKPKGNGPFPVVISFHGGPEAQFRPGFISTFQFWLNELGIAVIAPNVRGSAGYGKTYLKLDNGILRENSVKDGGQLLDWIAQQPELDEDRVGVFGGSYGGYMVLAMMTHYNDRIAAGVDVVGISNFVTFPENTENYRRDL
ncbi:MAG: S9 family peptidase, partial [Bacteroidota bacterium]